MHIIPFCNYLERTIIDKSCKNRNIEYILLNNIKIIGCNHIYPNCLLYDVNNNIIVSPYDEKIMSLNKEIFYENDYQISIKDTEYIINYEDDVFFFIYNFDNYYHFIYDTLAYICCYLELKKSNNKLRLLVSYPNVHMNTFYKFNEEIFSIFNIDKDIIVHNENCLYKSMYVANSITHGGKSNNPPHPCVYNLFNAITNKPEHSLSLKNKRIYISRRTWIHNNKSNIGTDYTQRRKMMNEDLLVTELVNKFQFQEIFCENMTMLDKIDIFKNSEIIVGAIGGGMCNLLFSPNTTKVVCIVSPYFLDINYRFIYSMNHTDIQYIYDTTQCSQLFTRIKVNDENSEYYKKIGEIIDVDADKDSYTINISDNDVAGFNSNVCFTKITLRKSQIEFLDKGLNSPYCVNIDKVLHTINMLI
jgi:capsular polysaccharide biosynthesis protein